jgi:hypothetical protein
MTTHIERVAEVLAAADAEARALGLPDSFMQMAQALDDAGLVVPPPMVGVTAVRVTETARAGWQVRYRLNGKRKPQRHFPSKDRADAWIDQQRAKHGGAPTSTASTVQGDDAS